MKFLERFFLILFFGLVAMVSGPNAVRADVPLAARLLAEPYTSTGVQVTVTNGGNMYGLANDGTTAYIINSSGNVVSVPFSSINMTAGGSVTVSGTSHTVGWGGGAPSWPNASNLSLAYSHGCLWITDSNNSEGSIKLYCIDVSDYSVTQIAVPAPKPLPAGNYYVQSSLIDFPDGRIGKVSAYYGVSGGYESNLRTYTITGTGKSTTLAWSEDFLMFDPDNWAVDEHGIATDGTYLYRIQWRDVSPNTKVWTLASGSDASITYSGSYTMPFDNMHFLSHNHTSNYYLMGHYSSNHFFITTAADPGPGPGSPLTPTFGTVSYTSGGFTAQVTNYDNSFTWSVGATSGSASISGTGLITVTGLSEGNSSTITASTTKTGFPNGSATVAGTLPDATAPSISSIAATSTASTIATITWTTNEQASTKVVYGLTSSYGTTTTSETDTSSRVTSHSKGLTSLLGCTTYHYAAVSRDATLNAATSTDNSFTTIGCTASSTPITSTSTSITSSSGGSTNVVDSGKTFTVSLPANSTATSSSVVIQVQATAKTAVLSELGTPANVPNGVGSIVFDVKAIINGSTILDSFDHAVTITYAYADSDVSGLNESTFWLYHYHNGSWQALSDCSVDTSANTITCTTPSFSIFGLFGSSSSSSSSSSGGGSGLPWCSGPSAPGWNLGLPNGGCGNVALPQASTASSKRLCSTYTFTRTLRFGMIGEDVRALQKLMNCLGFTLAGTGPGSLGKETNLFVERTQAAVITFQEKYAADILTPIGTKKGTGIFAEHSRKKAQLLAF